jgi:Kef-type K+ transport system membrane component KefB
VHCQKLKRRRSFHAMRQFLSLIVLGLIMALFHRLTGAGPLEARATLALGFLLLAAHLGGALARRTKLPRITAYLVTGLAVGPAWLEVVHADEIAALRFIGDAALALIAFAAGSEVRLDALRAERAVFSRISVAAVAFPFGVVTLATLAVSPWFPLTAPQGLGDAIAIALVLGTVAAASSPTVTVALMDDLDARGPFARTVLGVTLVQDVGVIVLLTLVLALVGPLVSEGALHLAVVWTAFARLVFALAAGAIAGVLVAQYLRIVRRDTALLLVALAFVLAEIGTVLGVEIILVAAAAGLYVGNFSRDEVGAQHAAPLRAVLRQASLPVSMVFFALAGAGLQLGAFGTDLWSWALLLIGLRTLGLVYGFRWAGQSPRVTAAVARHGWMGFMSQAGVILGLATVVRRAFPEWGVSLEALVVAMIGVHELVGPVLFRHALALAGEVKETEHVTNTSAVQRGPAPLPGGGV